MDVAGIILTVFCGLTALISASGKLTRQEAIVEILDHVQVSGTLRTLLPYIQIAGGVAALVGQFVLPALDDDENVVLLQEFLDHLALMFFRGVLLDDPAKVLHAQGPDTHGPKRMKFTTVGDVESLAEVIKTYVDAAIYHAMAGTELPPRPEEALATELQERLADNDELAEAFNDLTPGRRHDAPADRVGRRSVTDRSRSVDQTRPRARLADIIDGSGHAPNGAAGPRQGSQRLNNAWPSMTFRPLSIGTSVLGDPLEIAPSERRIHGDGGGGSRSLLGYESARLQLWWDGCVQLG